MKLHKISLSCAITLMVTISLSNFPEIDAAGFSIDLIHRDSLESPSLHSSSYYQVVGAALQRSFNRAKTLIPANYNSPQSSASTEIVLSSGEYLIKFLVGTPRVETLAIVDTGSDLTWIQCNPCRKCYKQKLPLFDSSRSSTYKTVPCRSTVCNSITSTACLGTKGCCSYTVRYNDNSFSTGDLAIDTITLGNNASFPHIVMGCGHISDGLFASASAGIVGLGRGKESLLQQMGPSIGGKFSYCLAPPPAIWWQKTKPSKIHLGDAAEVSGEGVWMTPILTNKFFDTFYFLTLLGMSVGNERINLSSVEYSEKLVGEGGGRSIIIDTGTTLTFLPENLYGKVEAAVKRQVSMKQISDPQKYLKLCYEATAGYESKIPEMTAHFKGADVNLKPYNTFVKTGRKAICLAFAETSMLPIYGNLAQINFLIGYDLVKKTLSFKPTDCTAP